MHDRDPSSAPGAAGLRIASLVPSITELVVALGLRDWLVARTGFCIHPAEALREVPKVGGTKDVNLAKLQRLAPTHVLVNVDENRRDTVDAIRAWPNPPSIIVTHPIGPDDNVELVALLGRHFGEAPDSPPRARAVVREHAAALTQALQRELAATQPDGRVARSVLYLIWRDPWMTVARDTYISRLLARVAWHTLPDALGGAFGAARYPVVRGDEPWLADVQRVLLSSEPYRFSAAHQDEARALCPNAEVQLVDGELLGWYGPRAVAGLRYLRGIAAAAGG